MLGVLAFLAFAAIWFVRPFKLRGTEGRPPFKWFVFALLGGMFFSFITSCLIQTGLHALFVSLGITGVVYEILHAFVMAALVEETMKFLTANFFTKKAGAIQKIDYMFLFGAVGLGFELIEGISAIIGNGIPIGAIFRFGCLHAFWLMFMGAFFYEYKMAKQNGESQKSKLMLAISLLVPFLLHGIHDIGLFLIIETPGFENIGFYIFVFDLIAEIAMIVYTLRNAYKEARLANKK